MIFLELESYIEPPLGYPDGPYFDSDLWPLILRRSDEVQTVLWFRHETPAVNESHFADLGPLTRQSDQMMETLKHRSYYGGHLNVLYVIQPESLLLRELVKLYPKPGVLYSDSTNNLGLPFEARSELARFVESLPPRWSVLSFCGDGDPACIFGDGETLEQLQVASASNKPPPD